MDATGAELEDKLRDWGGNSVFLNVAKLDALKARAGEERTEFWDRGLRGFGVRVYASGKKPSARRIGGESTYIAARTEAERIISEARHGRDPFISAVLLKKADISTFEALCQRYLEDPAPGRKGRVLAEETRKGMSRIIRKELVPVWILEIRTASSRKRSRPGCDRERRRSSEGGAVPGQSLFRLHGDDLFVGGAPAANALHALRQVGEAVRGREALADVQQ